MDTLHVRYLPEGDTWEASYGCRPGDGPRGRGFSLLTALSALDRDMVDYRYVAAERAHNARRLELIARKVEVRIRVQPDDVYHEDYQVISYGPEPVLLDTFADIDQARDFIGRTGLRCPEGDAGVWR